MTNDQHQDRSDPPSPRRPTAAAPETAAEWRDLLRKEQLPEEIDELPRRARRRAAKRWRSARREEREQAIRAARRKTPTPLAVPALALVIAGAVAVFGWLGPDDSERPQPDAKPSATPSAPGPETPTSPSPAATAPVKLANPDQIAEGFATAYSTRMLLQDATHTGAVQRAAPYASAALVANLKAHDDRDWNRLVASQANEAIPTKTAIALPTDKQRPAPDTEIRVWRQATVTVAVKGTDPYSYTREMTIEVSRADLGTPWMVTRVLGLEE